MATRVASATDRFVDQHRFAFVGGLHRSGTTLIAKSLLEHPQVSGLHATSVPEDEGQHLQDVYPTAQACGGPGRFGFSPRARLTGDEPLVSRANRDRLLASWQPYWDVSKLVLLEKSPPNLIRTRFLQALFPGAWFVIIIRHPLAVAAATRKWSRTSVASLLMHWLRCHEMLLEDAPKLERLCVIRYEDFVERPNPVRADTLAFLGLDAPPYRPVAGVEPDVNEAYFAWWDTRRIPVDDIRRLVAAERGVNAFGYSVLSPRTRVQPSKDVARMFSRSA